MTQPDPTPSLLARAVYATVMGFGIAVAGAILRRVLAPRTGGALALGIRLCFVSVAVLLAIWFGDRIICWVRGKARGDHA